MSLLSTWGFLRPFLISQAIRKETEEEHAPEVSALHQEDGQDWQSRCYWPGFSASFINRNWLEATQESQARLLLGSSSRGQGWRTSNMFPCLLPEGGQACSLYGPRVGVCPEVSPEGWLRWFAHPLGGGVCRGHAQYPAFAPYPLPSKVVVGKKW